MKRASLGPVIKTFISECFATQSATAAEGRTRSPSFFFIPFPAVHHLGTGKEQEPGAVPRLLLFVCHARQAMRYSPRPVASSVRSSRTEKPRLR